MNDDAADPDNPPRSGTRLIDLTEPSVSPETVQYLVDKMTPDLRVFESADVDAGTSPAEALAVAVLTSPHAWMVLDGPRPIAAFGVGIADEHGLAETWMFATPGLHARREGPMLNLARNYLSRLDVALHPASLFGLRYQFN